MKGGFPFLLCLMILTASCKDIRLEQELYVYFNDFNNESYTGIQGVYISEFNGERVMGFFNNSGFELHLDELPEHGYIRVSFDLYIHDSWDGNTNHLGTNEPDHDAWILEFEPSEKVKPEDKIHFETTFSNKLCIPGWCSTQSYPNEFPFSNRARTEAVTRSTNGRCLWQDSPVGTSIYRIDKVFPHKRKSTVLKFYDRLKTADTFSPLCDESWSLDNLSVTVFTTN